MNKDTADRSCLNYADLLGVSSRQAALLQERLRRLHDMEQAHGEGGALVVLAALWKEAQHTALRYPDEAPPVTSYRVRS